MYAENKRIKANRKKYYLLWFSVLEEKLNASCQNVLLFKKSYLHNVPGLTTQYVQKQRSTFRWGICLTRLQIRRFSSETSLGHLLYFHISSLLCRCPQVLVSNNIKLRKQLFHLKQQPHMKIWLYVQNTHLYIDFLLKASKPFSVHWM